MCMPDLILRFCKCLVDVRCQQIANGFVFRRLVVVCLNIGEYKDLFYICRPVYVGVLLGRVRYGESVISYIPYSNPIEAI